MKKSLQQAYKAYQEQEVPVGCIFVRRSNGKNQIVAQSHNLTNKQKNASKHCQINCINELTNKNIPINQCYLFVTVQPCIMCTHALNIMNIKKVYFGQFNDRFGGCGSVLKHNKFTFQGGFKQKQSLQLLKKFYDRGNQRIPQQKRKRKKVTVEYE